ncbi:response regulator transcription factor [Streptomyces griseoincarnatus]|uniref:helix-turn-helix transcriptional regulator n=1 Tax=Streptomyces sp. E2N171 TaxID=1851914 RepID=UPI001EE942CE|nr:response regulator transcription factor [Streptomyces sp. E2N171]
MTATLTATPVTATSSDATVTAAPAVVVRVLPAPRAERVRALAERAGLRSAADESAPCATVTVIVAVDADQALRAPRPPGRVLFVCDSVAAEDRRRILRAGAVVVSAPELDEESLLRAVHRAAYPHPSIPYPELSGALSTRGRADGPTRRRPPALTARQTSVLRLMAEGHGNADIALLLGCSEHTVKNVIYELMTRLQARNRAHAVAHAVRQGLV